MVKQIILSLYCLSTALFGIAQVAINEDQSNPAAGTILDVKSATKGLLIPRLPNNPLVPQLGMLYYNTTLNQFKYYNGLAWQIMSSPWRYNEANAAIYSSSAFIGINTSTPSHQLHVIGDSRISSNLYIGNRLAVNDPTINAVVSIKGNIGYGDWGQHIVLENSGNNEYGAILHDGGGMKFRNFGAGDGYFFRDINNENLLQISSTGNVTASGSVSAVGNLLIQGSATINNGKGVLSNAAGATNLKMFQFTVSNNNVNLSGGASQGFNIQFGGGFTATPQVFVGDIDNQTTIYTNQEFGWLISTIRGCALNTSTGITTCAAKIINTQNDNFIGTIRWNCFALGN